MTRQPAWLLLALGLLLAACASTAGIGPVGPTATGAETTTTAAPEPAPAAPEVVIGLGGHGSPRTLNPLLDGPDTAALDIVGAAVFASAFEVDPETLEIIPDLVQEIPTTVNGGVADNGDGTMGVVFRLQPGARWSDGEPVTGDDLRFTYEIATDPDLPIRRDVRDRYLKILPGSMAVTPDGVRFTMELGFEVERLFEVILPEHQVAGTDFADDWSERMWLGTGPFAFAEWQPGQYLVLTRNRFFGDEGAALPALDRVVVRFFGPGDPGLLAAFESRALDVAVPSDGGAALEGFAALAAQGAATATAPGLGWELLNFQFGPANRNEDTLNEHLEWRLAVARAIDRDLLAEEHGTVALGSIFDRYLPGLAGDAWSAYGYDVDRAKGQLWDLGNELDRDLFDGFGHRAVLVAPGEVTGTMGIAESVARMLRDARIGVEVQLEGSALFFGRTLDGGTWDLGAWRYAGGYGRAAAIDLISMFDPAGLPLAGTNFQRWGTVDSSVQDEATARFAETMELLQGEMDPAAADRLLRRAEEILVEQMVLLPLVGHQQLGVAYWADEVGGVRLNPARGIAWNLEEWTRVVR